MSGGALRRVPLDALHRASGATMTGFAGWDMPVRYASDLEEHHAVRTAAGLFDVSHMGQIELTGPAAAAALESVLVSRVADLAQGRARYTMLCDDAGEVVDDLIVSCLHPSSHYLVVANAANTDAVLAALAAAGAGRDVTIRHAADRALLALQGPLSAEVLERVGSSLHLAALRPFQHATAQVAGVPVLLSRTGYTGEDGAELACDSADAAALWQALLAAGGGLGVRACGLAARDTLRLEAGLPLHGHELGNGLGPFEIGFGRIVHLDDGREFQGRQVLAQLAEDGPARRVVGLVAEGRRAPRAGYSVWRDGAEIGTVTSGAPSPTLQVPIALAALATPHSQVGTEVEVDVRGTRVPARVVDLPFVPRPR